MTVYKHILGRRRILIYTLPPVEASCILCQVAADMCYEDQVDYEWMPEGGPPVGVDAGGSHIDGSARLKGRCRESVKVLGMVTLNDLDMLQNAGKCGRGWIACTTDAIFLDKPSCYDLIIDLTTCTPSKASRPTLYLSRPIEPVTPRGPTHRLSPVRFTWSDVKLWSELERLLHRDSGDDDDCCVPSAKSSSGPPSGWSDMWRLYEDVCIICASLWIGTWRTNTVTSYSAVDGNMTNWGQVQLEGDDNLNVGGSYVRNLGMGIEGRPVDGQDSQTASVKSTPQGSGTFVWSKFNIKDAEVTEVISDPCEAETFLGASPVKCGARDRQVLTTLALLQTFHAHTAYILSRLSCFLPSTPSVSLGIPKTIILTPKDLWSFELGPLSGLDARFIEWLGDEYGSQTGVQLVVRKGWRDLVGLIFGLG